MLQWIVYSHSQISNSTTYLHFNNTKPEELPRPKKDMCYFMYKAVFRRGVIRIYMGLLSLHEQHVTSDYSIAIVHNPSTQHYSQTNQATRYGNITNSIG